jgi:hypothetical protein
VIAPISFSSHAARATPVAVATSSRDLIWSRHRPRLIEFDAPGAATVSSPVCAPYCGTVAYANNDSGAIVGFYTDKYVVPHAFLRYPNGFVRRFDAPGAGLGHGLNEGTGAYAINRHYAIAGQYQDSHLVYHGFLRHPDGMVTTFSDPLGGTTKNLGTYAWDVNDAEQTAGIYLDAKGNYHGFLRDPSGTFTTVDPPGSVFTYVCEETCLSTDGTVAGSFENAKGIQYGFLRAPDGKFTTFSAPGASATRGGGAASLTDEGVIAGYFYDPEAQSLQSVDAVAFVRYKNGSIRVFPDSGFQTVAYSINCANAIAGALLDKNAVYHGFERRADGAVATFDAPDAAPIAGLGTRVSTNNARGEVTGWYFDKKELVHGFVWLP